MHSRDAWIVHTGMTNRQIKISVASKNPAMSNKIDNEIPCLISSFSHSNKSLLKVLTDLHVQLISTFVRIEEIEQILGRQSEWSRIEKVGFQPSGGIGKRLRTLKFGRQWPCTCSKQNHQGRLWRRNFCLKRNIHTNCLPYFLLRNCCANSTAFLLLIFCTIISPSAVFQVREAFLRS